MLRDALESAYRRTRYRVWLARGRTLDLRIGRRCPALDALLATRGLRDWAFLTASNPGSRALPAWRNAARNRCLARAIAGAGFAFLPAAGQPQGDDWREEASVLLLGVCVARALRLGRQFDQNAVLAGRRGACVRLCWCRPGAGRLIG